MREAHIMGLVKTRRLAAMQKQTTYAKVTVVRQRAKAGLKPLVMKGQWKGNGSSLLRSGGSSGRKDAR